MSTSIKATRRQKQVHGKASHTARLCKGEDEKNFIPIITVACARL
jgi:hypothetical protein